jgi:hypothetical protein
MRVESVRVESRCNSSPAAQPCGPYTQANQDTETLYTYPMACFLCGVYMQAKEAFVFAVLKAIFRECRTCRKNAHAVCMAKTSRVGHIQVVTNT